MQTYHTTTCAFPGCDYTLGLALTANDYHMVVVTSPDGSQIVDQSGIQYEELGGAYAELLGTMQDHITDAHPINGVYDKDLGYWVPQKITEDQKQALIDESDLYPAPNL